MSRVHIAGNAPPPDWVINQQLFNSVADRTSRHSADNPKKLNMAEFAAIADIHPRAICNSLNTESDVGFSIVETKRLYDGLSIGHLHKEDNGHLGIAEKHACARSLQGQILFGLFKISAAKFAFRHRLDGLALKDNLSIAIMEASGLCSEKVGKIIGRKPQYVIRAMRENVPFKIADMVKINHYLGNHCPAGSAAIENIVLSLFSAHTDLIGFQVLPTSPRAIPYSEDRARGRTCPRGQITATPAA